MWPSPSTIKYIDISVLVRLPFYIFPHRFSFLPMRKYAQHPPLQQQAKVRSIVQAIGFPVEAYLACQDDYYRKVFNSIRMMLMECWSVVAAVLLFRALVPAAPAQLEFLATRRFMCGCLREVCIYHPGLACFR